MDKEGTEQVLYMISNGLDTSETISLPSQVERSARMDEMMRLSNKRAKLNEDIKKFTDKIKPMEFESYHEYFLIHTFRKGISASGHVDIERLRSRSNGVSFRRSKRNIDNNAGTPSASNPANSTNSDSEDGEDGEDERYGKSGFFVVDTDADGTLVDSTNTTTKRVTRAQLAAKKETQMESESQQRQPRKSDRTFINGDISTSSIIRKSELEGNVRRSSRLSQKANQASTGNSAGDTLTDIDVLEIKDLYESLVPKVKEPYRRSDWVLPSRDRYTPEKQMRTKHSHEIVKVNELVGTDRIRSVLSKFEGGVAGVRKRA